MLLQLSSLRCKNAWHVFVVHIRYTARRITCHSGAVYFNRMLCIKISKFCYVMHFKGKAAKRAQLVVILSPSCLDQPPPAEDS